MRQIYWYLGTGQTKPLDWFLPLLTDNVQDDFTENLGAVTEGDVVVTENTVDGIEDDVNVTEYDVVVTEAAASVTLDNAAVTEDNENEAIEIKENLRNILNQLESKLLNRIDNDLAGYKKAVEVFGKSVGRLPVSSDSALQKSLCSFAKTVTQVCFI